MPVPESNGEEWDRLEPASALDALVELVLHGEYNGLNSEKRVKDGLELRTAAVGVFEVSCRLKLLYLSLIIVYGRILFARMKLDMRLCRGCFQWRALVRAFFLSS